MDRKWVRSCRFSSVQTQKEQAKRSTSPLSTSSLPIFCVSSMIRLSDIRTAMFDTDNQLRHCGRPRSGPTARKWCRKLVLSNHQQEFHVNISSSNGFPSSYLSLPSTAGKPDTFTYLDKSNIHIIFSRRTVANMANDKSCILWYSILAFSKPRKGGIDSVDVLSSRLSLFSRGPFCTNLCYPSFLP